MRQRSFLFIVLLLTVLLSLSACNGQQAAEAPKTQEPVSPSESAQAQPTKVMEKEPSATMAEGEKFRVAVVLPSTITDLAWSQALMDALKRIQEEMGGADKMEIAYTENMWNVTDAAAAIRDYADNGYDLVIAHGTQYGTSLFEIAPDFPETSFAWGTATDTGKDKGIDNVFAYEARAEEGGFVLGVLAARLSKSGVIGVVGPVEAGDAKLYIDGFAAGAKYANPGVQVNISYTGSFGDTALAAEAANTHISAGADVLTGSAQQVVGAIGVCKEKGVPWLGIQADQSSVAPDIVLATDVYDWRPTILKMIEYRSQGILGGKVLQLTLANGGQSMVYHKDLPQAIVAAAKAAEKGLIDGSIVIKPEPR